MNLQLDIEMFKSRNLLALLWVFSSLVVKAQNNPNETIVIMQFEAIQPNKSVFSKKDTFLVRNDFILEPIKVNYATGETDFGTGVSREISVGKRLKCYNLTNYREMIGMSFDIEKKISVKTIETYRVSDGSKLGIRFITEPYLNNGFSVSDFIKDKDTIINGTKYFLIKNNRVASSRVRGSMGDKISQVRILINPSLKSYAFPFISENIVQEFGGGAIMYIAFVTDRGFETTVRYTYSPFTPVETSLFDHWQAVYDANVTLLDRIKKKG